MKEKMYVASSLTEVEELAVKELGVAKDDMYFDVISENNDEVQVNVIVDANIGVFACIGYVFFGRIGNFVLFECKYVFWR